MAIDVSEADFQREVIEQSQKIPVLVDFWAEWCGPCRMLGPVLEKVERDLGNFVLAKVNTDENPGISAQYKISGIPAVKLFVGGKLTAEFTGALPEPMVLRFLEEHLPDESLKELLELANTDPVKAAGEALSQNKTGTQASEIYWQACLALLARGETEGSVENFLKKIPGSGVPHSEAANAVRQLLKEAKKPSKALSELLSLLPKANGNPASLAPLFEQLLKHVEEAAPPEKDVAKQELLLAFQLIGNNSPLANEYRKKLSRLLF